MAWSQQQDAAQVNGSGASLTVPITAGTLNGVLTAVARIGANSESLTSVSDNAGNTWVLVNGGTPVVWNSSTLRTYAAYAIETNAGATSVTFNFSGSASTNRVQVDEWVNSTPGAPVFDASWQCPDNQPTTTTPSVSATPTNPGELIVGYLTLGTASAGMTPGTGYTLATVANQSVGGEYKASGTTAETVAFGLPSTKVWAEFVLAFAAVSTPSDADSATLSDTASTAAAVSSTDAATLSEQVATALSGLTDSASLTEGQIGIALASLDSAGLSEAVKIALGTQDTASLSELVSLAASIAAGDSAALSEAQSIAASLSATDAATVSEAAQVSSSGGTTPSGTDSGTLGEQASTTAAVSEISTAALAESAAVLISPGADQATLNDLTAQIAAGLQAADGAGLVEQFAVAVSASTVDTGRVQELVNVALAIADAAGVSESASVSTVGAHIALTVMAPARTLVFAARARSLTFIAPTLVAA